MSSSTSYCGLGTPLLFTARQSSKSPSLDTAGISPVWLTSACKADRASDLRDAIVVLGGVVIKIVSLSVLSKRW